MKAVSLYQPWATLIAIKAKKIETRGWGTRYRGPLAIHASLERKYIDMRSKYYMCDKEPFYSIFREYYRTHALAPILPRGVILAICDLTNCLKVIAPFLTSKQIRKLGTSANQWSDIQYFPSGRLPISDQERAFGDYTPGRFMLFLENVRELKKPIPARGALGLWEWTSPQDMEFK